MSHRSTTAKRVAVAALGACLLMLGTPLLGVAPAQAVDSSPGAAQIAWNFPPADVGITRLQSSTSNGTNSQLRFSVNTTVPDADHDRVSAVRFAYTMNGGASVLAGTVNRPPWQLSIAAPPGGTTSAPGAPMVLSADALNAAGSVINSSSISIGAVTNLPTSHVVSPAGQTLQIAGNGTVSLSGTTSSSYVTNYVFQSLSVRNNATGVVSAWTPFASGTQPSGVQGSGAWS